MSQYLGKLSPAPSIRNFGGVSDTSSDLNMNPNGAREDLNWDLTLQGSLIKRSGFVSLCPFDLAMDGVFLFVTDTGTVQEYAISAGVVYQITGGSKTALSATGCVITAGVRWRGWQWQGKLWLANGLNPPIVIIPGSPSVVKTMTQVSMDANSGVSKLPTEWSASPPIGFTVVNRGQDERMFAWNRTKVYFCELGAPTNWLTTGVAGAGAFIVGAADGDSIQAVIGKFGYTVVFTTERTLVYSGDGPGSTDGTTTGITLSYILIIGCPGGPDSVIQVGSDTYFWSEYGPANLMRLLNATEMNSNLVGIPVQPHIMKNINRDAWQNIVGYHDVKRRRVIWFAPMLGDSTPNMGYIYQYDIKAWYRYKDWSVTGVSVAPNGTVYASVRLPAGGFSFVNLHQGSSDAGADIEAVYLTMPYYFGSPDMSKTVPYVDVICRNDIDTLEVDYDFDYGSYEGSQVLDVITDGGEWGESEADLDPLVMRWGPGSDETTGQWGAEITTQLNRVDIYGIGKLFSLAFISKGQGTVEIMGWRTSPREKGLR